MDKKAAIKEKASSALEAILFWKAEPVSKKELSRLLDLSDQETDLAIVELRDNLKSRGISVIETGTEVSLRTSSEYSELIADLTKQELNREISRAGVEILSLVIYRGPISKREIDYIRGVNSSHIIRSLMIRGLIDKADGEDGRSSHYKPSIELLSYLGINSIQELDNFETVKSQIDDFISSQSATAAEETSNES